MIYTVILPSGEKKQFDDWTKAWEAKRTYQSLTLIIQKI